MKNANEMNAEQLLLLKNKVVQQLEILFKLIRPDVISMRYMMGEEVNKEQNTNYSPHREYVVVTLNSGCFMKFLPSIPDYEPKDYYVNVNVTDDNLTAIVSEISERMLSV